MKSIKRFFNCSVPINTCNLRCQYCFVTQTKEFEKQTEDFPVSPKLIAKALSQERVGGVCQINLCGLGETLLQEEVIEVVELLLEEGHVVSIVTNATLRKRIHQLCDLRKDLKKNLFIKCSFQYAELVRLNMMNLFFDNVQLLRENGISYTIEIVADDAIINEIDRINRIFDQREEAYPQVLECRDNTSSDIQRLTELGLAVHQAIWGEFHSELFEAQQTLWGEKRTEFCYAGEFSADIDLKTGAMTPCSGAKKIQNIYEHIDEPLQFCAIGHNCSMPHCFISYVWQGLCGNIDEIIYPRYSEMRNRKRPDGSEWLNDVIAEYFSLKFSDANGRYSEKKKMVVNGFMTAYHKGAASVREDDFCAIKEYIDHYCKKHNIHTAYIYGMAGIGQILCKVLEAAQIEVLAVADHKKDIIDQSRLSVTTEQFWRGEHLDQAADMIVITPISDNRSLEIRAARTFPDTMHILNIMKILNEME